MQCQECQNRPATLHLKQVVNGQKQELHVCEVCALEKGYINESEESYSLQQLLSGLFNFESSALQSPHQNKDRDHRKEDMQCPKCGLTLSGFNRTGKFGCAECYETFADRLDPVFRRVHSGNTRHQGKIPKRRGSHLHTRKQLDSYKAELQKLVEQEAFEDAALVRDKIKELKREIDDKEAGEDT